MSNALDITPGKHSKIIETENYISIMSNLYLKENLSCLSKKGCVFNKINSGDNILNLSSYMMLSGQNSFNGTLMHNDFGIVPDPYIKNRYYYMVDNRLSNVDLNTAVDFYTHVKNYIIIAEEDNTGDIQIIAVSSLTGYTFEHILDIDRNYLYVSARFSNRESYYGERIDNNLCIFKINKNTGANAQTILRTSHSEKAHIDLIYKDETCFYCTYQCNLAGSDCKNGDQGGFKVICFNKSSGELKTNSYKTHEDVSTGFNQTEIHDVYKEDNKYYWCYLAQPDSNKNHLMTICFDPSKGFTNTNQVITISSINSFKNIDTIKWSNNIDNTSFYECRRIWIVDNYMYLAIYDEMRKTDAISYQGIHVFKINAGFELEYITKIQINNTSNIMSMCFNSDKTILLVGYNGSFEIYHHDSDTHLYEKTIDNSITEVICAGIDSMNRIWYQNNNNGVFCENLDDPQEVDVRFEKLFYTYNNEDILTYLTMSAKSFSGKVPQGRYILTLSNNAKFVSTDTNTLTIIYDGDDTIRYPLKIIGPKRVSCTVTFEKIW